MDPSASGESNDYAETITALGVAGISVDNLCPAKKAGCGVGLSTLTTRRKGEELLRLPPQLYITDHVEDAPENLRPALEAILQHANEAASQWRLCVRLWYEKLQPSNPVFAAWIPALAAAATACARTCALRWDQDTIARCGVLSSIQRHVVTTRQKIEALHQALAELAKQFPSLFPQAPDPDEAEWLYLVCHGRALVVHDRLSRDASGVSKTTLCMVPLFDLAHSHVANDSGGAIAEFVTGTLIVSTRSALQAGDQVLSIRCPLANEELAIYSSCAVHDNPHQQVSLRLGFGVIEDSKLATLKRLKLDQFLLVDNEGKAAIIIVMRNCDPFPNVAIVLARVLFGSETSPDLQKMISPETVVMDNKWLPTILDSLKAQLQRYPARNTADPDAADLVYHSSRIVLKASVAQLLEFSKKLTPA